MEDEVGDLEVLVFDVEHGFCAFVRTPNGYGILYDCGRASNFSPVKFVHQNVQLTPFQGHELAQLVVSHPHDDHIEDIDRLVELMPPAILHRQRYSWDEVKAGDDPEGYENLDEYSGWQASYSSPVDILPDWGCDISIGPYLTPGEAKQLGSPNFVNNSSIPMFISYNGWKVALTGDLETVGWLELLEDASFRERLRGTDIFVTSHHGHSSGFCREVYDVMGKPTVNIVSIHHGDDSCDAAYSSKEYASGCPWYGDTRYRLTTRSDGPIQFRVTGGGKAFIDSYPVQPNI